MPEQRREIPILVGRTSHYVLRMQGDPFRFCVEILPQVSRTFAINIRVLTGDLHRSVLCAYLFCRIVDTAEDSEQLALYQRMCLLQSYGAIFSSRSYSPESLESWIRSWGALDPTNAEHRLIIGLPQVVAVFLQLPEPMRALVEACVIEMSAGMRETVALKKAGGDKLITLESMQDLKKYCHYVAGTVGQMLTELFLVASPDLNDNDRQRLRQLGPSFALGLQMTNIIKDCHSDYQRGWCYIPSELMEEHSIQPLEFFSPAQRLSAQGVLDVLIVRTAVHLDAALEYTLLIPRSHMRIRLFNLWSLFFAIKTLRKSIGNAALLSGRSKVKISRAQVYWTLIQTTICVRSNGLLRWAFGRLRRSIPIQ